MPWIRADAVALDPFAARRSELARLQALGVVLNALGRVESQALFARFEREFIAPEEADRFADDVKRRGLDDLQRWMRHDCTLRTTARGCLAWLGSTDPRATCVRFEKQADLPALEIFTATLEETWAASWPGVFVNFEAGRALVITVDYEVLRCDLGARGMSPYR